MSKKSKEVKPSSAWWCETCNSAEMKHPEMIAHLQEKHGLNTTGLECRKEMLMHMDGDTWFSYKWKITVKNNDEEIIMTNETMQPRRKDDMMRFA